MNELHSHRAFTNAGGHALDRTVPDIAHREQAGNIRFQKEGVALQRPGLRTLTFPEYVRTSEDKAAVISLYDVTQPIRARQGANKSEHGGCGHTLNFIGIGTKHRNLFQMSFTMCFRDVGVCPELDVWRVLNLLNQIL